VNGLVRDPSGAVVPGAEVQLINEQTNTRYPARTNREGIYSVPNLPPGTYRIQVSKVGFKTIIKPDIVLNVLDARAINFDLPVGAASETVTVDGGAAMIDPDSFSVSTVIDRQFAENLPLNGRSFQSLIELTPGVVLTPSNSMDSGQFSINGQRAASNYWMVDGVSANIGVGVNSGTLPGNGLGGALGSFSAQGGTNSLVSVDAMQEFRIETSTYAPEFGRTPGGQISIVTRSGTNQFHGTVFDYLRNDALDANDWITDQHGLPKPQERQNDFGGTLGGAVLKNRTFFFFSYEGQRLRLPQVGISDVPDLNARQSAAPALQPFLNAFPLPGPNTPDDLANGIGQFNASYSDRSTLDAYSLRIDHTLRNNLFLFGRYNDSPSQIAERGHNASALSIVSNTRISTQTATAGATWALSPTVTLDSRFNYSRTNAMGHDNLDTFGGAVPLSALPFPSPFTSQDGSFFLTIASLLRGNALSVGATSRNLMRQINIVDSLVLQKGSHSLKVGVDYRRLSPFFAPHTYQQNVNFFDVPSAESGTLWYGSVYGSISPTFLFRNLGLYAQDTWHIVPRLTLTYGLRWDLDFAPQSLSGPNFPAVTGFNLDDLSKLALASSGAPPYNTTYGNIAPRFGLAYQLVQSQSRQAVLRGGFGVFYDLASSEAGNSISTGLYPFGSTVSDVGPTFPFSSTGPLPIQPPSTANPGGLFAIDPRLKLPYTLEWNVALEQALGQKQTLSLSYIGAAGRRLLQSAYVPSPTLALSAAQLLTNASTSNYRAVQVQFQRRLSRGLQALASYTWSRSIDTASAGSAFGSPSNILSSTIENENRGPSDFDIRNTFSAGVTYDLPSPWVNSVVRAILGGWSSENFIVARSAPPVTVLDATFGTFNGTYAAIRPDFVPGHPLYLYGDQCANVLEPLAPNSQKHLGCPGGKGLNPSAFTDPPTSGCVPGVDYPCDPTRQGSLGRNALRGFGAVQCDFAIHRDFAVHESIKLQFRAEMFNALNHPNFGPPGTFFPYAGFGVSSQTLGQSLNANQGGGGFSSLYQIGGPRSIQVALKLSF